MKPLARHDDVGAVLKQEIAQAWREFAQRHPDHDVYGFGVYTTHQATYGGIVICSEQGLHEAAVEHARRTDTDVALQMSSLRWSPGDSPFFEEGLTRLSASFALRALDPQPFFDEDEAAVQRATDRFLAAIHDAKAAFRRSSMGVLMNAGEISNAMRAFFDGLPGNGPWPHALPADFPAPMLLLPGGPAQRPDYFEWGIDRFVSDGVMRDILAGEALNER